MTTNSIKSHMQKVAILILFLFATSAHAVLKLSLVSSGYNHMSFYLDGTTGEYTFQTTGGDPYVYTIPLPRDLDADETCLYFEYKSSKVLSGFQLYFGNEWAESRSKIVGNLRQTDTWKEVEWNLSTSIKQFGWGKEGQQLRIDPGKSGGIEVMMRNIRFRKKGDTTEDAATIHARGIQEYLKTDYPCSIDNVTVGNTNIVVSGTVPSDGGEYYLVELPMYAEVTEDSTFVSRIPLAPDSIEGNNSCRFTVSTSRQKITSNVRRDCLLSKWAIVKASAGKDRLASHARYADDIAAKRSATLMPLKGKKGLGGFYVNENLSDLDDLGIASVTVNMVLNALINDKTSFADNITYSYNGRQYNIDRSYLSSFDRIFKACYSRGIVTSVILLVQPDKNHTLCHPDNTGGYYSMPNLTTQAAINTYAAIISYLANRYSGTQYGRINHWILHNEVDYATTWTNMGAEVPVLTYLDSYLKSMRLVSNIASQYDQNASVLASYTHSWNSTSTDGMGYSSHNMLNQTVLFSQAEGDFRWGVAYHPYPQNLLEPCFWLYDTAATYDMESPFCTFKNLEVINSWILQPEHFFKDGSKRLMFLSENGTNSRDYSANQLTYQAAGACWAWKKTNRLDGIDGIQWHNWRDNREEFGLCIGLRRYPDDETDPNGCKPVWYVWQAAGTDREEQVFDKYLSTVGQSSWDGIFDEKMIEDDLGLPASDRKPDSGIYDLAGRRLQGERLRKGIYVIGGRKVLVR